VVYKSNVPFSPLHHIGCYRILRHDALIFSSAGSRRGGVRKKTSNGIRAYAIVGGSVVLLSSAPASSSGARGRHFSVARFLPGCQTARVKPPQAHSPYLRRPHWCQNVPAEWRFFFHQQHAINKHTMTTRNTDMAMSPCFPSRLHLSVPSKVNGSSSISTATSSMPILCSWRWTWYSRHFHDNSTMTNVLLPRTR
jgi:hypothetical protein